MNVKYKQPFETRCSFNAVCISTRVKTMICIIRIRKPIKLVVEEEIA